MTNKRPAIPERLGPTDFEKGYIPFPVALELGKIDPENFELHRPNEALEALSRGKIPEKGGIFYVPGLNNAGGFGAVDFQAFRRDGDKYEILPTSRSAVDSETHDIMETGGVILTLPDGLLRLSAIALDRSGDWNPPRRPRFGKRSSGLTIVSLGLEAEDLELQEIGKSGSAVAKRRTKLIAFSEQPKYKK